MKITFLGTNGWHDSPMGNTPSVLIDSKFYYVVFDAGFGFAKLHNYLTEQKPIFLFLSHYHLDHVAGLHTLGKLKIKELTIVGQKNQLKKNLKALVRHPFAEPFNELKFKVHLLELKPGIHHLPFEVKCLPLHHIDPTFGYRLELEGKKITYCSDTAVCDNDRELSKDVDVLIHECALQSGPGDEKWGHTSPELVGELAASSGVKKLVLTHFGAEGYDTPEKRKDAEHLVSAIFPEVIAAFDGFSLEI